MTDGSPGWFKGTVWGLSRRTWVVVIVLVLVVALLGHSVLVINAANSLEVQEVRVISVSPGIVLGDFIVVFEIVLNNPTSSTIDVDALTYDLFLEDEFIGAGEKTEFGVRPGLQGLQFEVTFNVNDLPAPVQELYYGSSATLTIEGEVTVPIKLLGIWRVTEVTLPYEHEEEVSSETDPPDNPPPNPVLLAPPVYRITASAALTWSMNGDADFSRYEVHHSTNAAFEPSEATKVTDIMEQSTTTYTVGNLDHITTHYFIIRVYDSVGQHADSNVGSIFIP
ncbi:MAG: LEA type 2 family protein [Thermoplasmata archaeon]|nr:MAG: LEA type 2 family protein [Thermoplasmata archaeon]